MVNYMEIGDRDNQGNSDRDIGIIQELLFLQNNHKKDDACHQKSEPEEWVRDNHLAISPLDDHLLSERDARHTSWRSARTRDAIKPVKEPDTDRAGQIKNRLTNFDLDVLLHSFHTQSPSQLIDDKKSPMTKASTQP
jgi:hypothetical protein